ncbi:MAG: hypothetical protein HYZ14_12705 [Bacteroidetes bacterium]|nr:hypothetical protein [Bacteroidota bacterium]
MRPVIILSIASVFFAISSCCYCGNKDAETAGHDSLHHDTLTQEVLLDSNYIDTGGYVNDTLANQNEIEAKYGVQWDFCDCVVKNDSIEKAIMNTEDEAQIDLILIRMDEVDQHCKAMLAQPNVTPEQRDKHARKVRKCLKEAGVL